MIDGSASTAHTLSGADVNSQETIRDFATHPTSGLSSSALATLLARYGPNEFELPAAESLWLKFAKGVYENPLNLLLLGSSAVSALMGQYDDAICVVVAVTIVLTGTLPEYMVCNTEFQSALCKNSGPRNL